MTIRSPRFELLALAAFAAAGFARPLAAQTPTPTPAPTLTPTPTPSPTPTPPAVPLLERLYPGQMPANVRPTPNVAETITTSTLRIRRPRPPAATPGAIVTPRTSDRPGTPTTALLPMVSLNREETTPTLERRMLAPRATPPVRLATPAQAARPTSASLGQSTPPPVALGLVRVNAATAEEMMEKLKIDARRARLIVEFRNLYGPFRTPEDLGQVSGLNDTMVRQWESAGQLDFH